VATLGRRITASLIGLFAVATCWASGVTGPNPVFTDTRQPALPQARQAFSRGDLGLIKTTYGQFWLYIAYRYLSGQPLTDQERQVLFPSRPVVSGQTEWLKIRNALMPDHPLRFIDTNVSDGQYFENCGDDAFKRAVRAYEDLNELHDPVRLAEWVKTQDQVFSNCNHAGSIPAGPDSTMAEPWRSQRLYQVAAANFYAGNFEATAAGFRAIAADPRSGLEQLARYLAVRALIRQAMLKPPAGAEFDSALLEQARHQLQVIAADPSTTMRAAAIRLVGFIDFRLTPESRLHELAQHLQHPVLAELNQDLIDYRALLDVVGQTRYGALSPAQHDDLTTWMYSFQSREPREFDRAFAQWQKTPTEPWLIAALAKAHGQDARQAQLTAAVDRLSPTSPAFLTAAYHKGRLLVESGQGQAARSYLESMLQRPMAATVNNEFRALRMQAATGLYDWLRFAPRSSLMVSYDDDYRDIHTELANRPEVQANEPWYLDMDSALVINQQMPLSVIERAVTMAALPKHVRNELATSGWVRAVLLGNEEEARTLAQQVAVRVPTLSESMQAYWTGASAAERQFTAVFTILRFPGLQPFVPFGLGRGTPIEKIDDLRDNWWCQTRQENGYFADREKHRALPNFLSKGEVSQGEHEYQLLSALPPDSNWLTQQVLAWSDTHPDDPRIPQALYLAVKATRFGCTDGATGALSKQAFDRLHQNYKESVWAKKTPYWFE
jgi:hypothetical protein